MLTLPKTWLDSIAGHENKETPVTHVTPPLYDNVLCCLELPINVTSYQRIDLSDINFEGVWAHTKSRWLKITTESPKDQKDDLAKFGLHDLPSN